MSKKKLLPHPIPEPYRQQLIELGKDAIRARAQYGDASEQQEYCSKRVDTFVGFLRTQIGINP